MTKSAKTVMMSAHALCPTELSHPQRMEWMSDYFLKNYTSTETADVRVACHLISCPHGSDCVHAKPVCALQ